MTDQHESPEAGIIQMLQRDNQRMRDAGCKLAEAAIYVARNYDGIHRLMLATSEWSMAIANEGDRGQNTDVSEKSKKK